MKDQNILTYASVQDSIPKATAGAGTISSVNNHRQILGSGTAFLANVNPGDYIYIKGQNEFQRVIDIQSDTALQIEGTFTSNLSATAYHITPNPRSREVEIEVTGLGDALIDGVTYEQGEVEGWSKRDKGRTINDYVLPIDVDTNTNSTTVRVKITH